MLKIKILIFLMLVVFITPAYSENSYKLITILHTNDIHGEVRTHRVVLRAWPPSLGRFGMRCRMCSYPTFETTKRSRLLQSVG